jgi:sigma-E factor negative regulatory protein RseC
MAHEAKEVAVTADNRAEARVGDSVVLELSDREVLKAAFLIYIVPVLFLFIGVSLGTVLGLTETHALLMGLAGLVSSFLLLKFVVDPYIRRQAGYHLVIICAATPVQDKES